MSGSSPRRPGRRRPSRNERLADRSRAMTLILCSSAVGLALAVACQRAPGGRKGAQDAGATIVGPENVAVVKPARIQTGPRLSGTLEPKEQARVRSQSSGSVDAVDVEVGQAVKEGQVLARIEDRVVRGAYGSAQLAVRSAAQDLELAQRQVVRTRRLVQEGALSAHDLESATSAKTTAQARLAQARAQLADAAKQLDAAVVKSPMNGIVSERAVNAGDVVQPGSPLFTIIDPSSMRLTASVPSEDLGALAVGKPVDFTVRGYGEQVFVGRIDRIAPAADPQTRQITVLVAIPNESGKLLSGLYAEGRVVAQSRQTLTVPLSALNEAAGRTTVMRVRDGVVHEVAVQTGLRDEQEERVELLSGVSPGDLVLVGPAKNIADGTPVVVQTPTQPEAQR